MKKSQLREYARLIARSGVNVQSGQEVIISASLGQPEFVYMLTEECYIAGASKVSVEWNHQPLVRLNVKYQSEEKLSAVENWETEKIKHSVETLPAIIYLESDDPDGLSGIDQSKYSSCLAARRAVLKPYRDEMDNRRQWCIAAVPDVKWAKKVFPGVRSSVAVERLWQAILSASRAEGDAIKNWREHDDNLLRRCEYLNSLCIDELHYTSSNGTDLTIGLLENGRFMGGCDTLIGSDVAYNANIPSEEVFTSPDRLRANGVVYASMPLSHQGQLIENFHFVLKNGKITEAYAEKNEELLNSVLDMDEGARYLGEVALVPFDSPIRNSGILFYNTLFDENAACHIAFGEGFNFCLQGYESMTPSECKKQGINDSLIHVDFMIGTADLRITAKTRSGEVIDIFVDGNWAF